MGEKEYFSRSSPESFNSYHKVPEHHCHEEEYSAAPPVDLQTVPHRLNPFATQYPEDDHEGMSKIAEIPPRDLAPTVGKSCRVLELMVALAKEGHAENSKDKY